MSGRKGIDCRSREVNGGYEAFTKRSPSLDSGFHGGITKRNQLPPDLNRCLGNASMPHVRIKKAKNRSYVMSICLLGFLWTSRVTHARLDSVLMSDS